MKHEDFDLVIRGFTESKKISLTKDMTVEDLKTVISFELNIPAEDINLYYQDRFLNIDEIMLKDIFDFRNSIEVVVKKQSKKNVVAGRKESGIEGLMKNPTIKSMLRNKESIKMIKNILPDIFGDNENISTLLNSGCLEEEMEKMAEDGYMKSQLRNADIAMAKLENMPGGINIMNSFLKGLSPSASNIFTKAPVYNVGEKINKDALETPKRNSDNVSSTNPYIEYRSQNAALLEIGYTDVPENFKALIAAKGDIDNAIKMLNSRKNN